MDQPQFSLSQDPAPIRKGQFFMKKEYFSERSQISPRKILSQLAIPTYLLYGDLDEKLDRASGEIKEIATTFCVPGVGHLFESVDARKQLLEKMKEIL
jgi:hypothetical protein